MRYVIHNHFKARDTSEKNASGYTLQGYIRRVQKEAKENYSQLTTWRVSWNGLCEDFWKFDFAPSQALEAIEKQEGVG